MGIKEAYEYYRKELNKDKKGLPSISLMLLVKDEFDTLARSIASVSELCNEVVIGVDKETDSPMAIAYRTAFFKAPKEECENFFESFLKEDRYPTIEEISEFCGEPYEEFVAQCEAVSKDGPTRLVIEGLKKEFKNIKVVDIDFNDHFSNARNVLIEECTGEYIMFLDGHEFLEGEEQAIEAIIGYANMGVLLRAGFKVDMYDTPSRPQPVQTRLWKNIPEARFERGIHNRLVIKGNEEAEECFIPDCKIVHDRPKWLEQLRRPQRQRMVDKHMGTGKDLSSIYYRGASAHRKKDYRKAIKEYSSYLSSGGTGVEASVVCSYVGDIIRNYWFEVWPNLKPDAALRKAEKWYLKGIEYFPMAAHCHLGLASCKMMAEDPGPQGLHIAAQHAQIAMQCPYPACTISVPTAPFTWDGPLKMAEIARRIGDSTTSLAMLHKSLDSGLPDPYREEVIKMLPAVSAIVNEQMDKQLRVSLLSGDKRLVIFDSDGQFSWPVKEVAEEMGMDVVVAREYDRSLVASADAIWCDWMDETAAICSGTYLGDRKLFIRCHSYESFTDYPGLIDCDNVSMLMASAKHVADKLKMKFLNFGNAMIKVVPAIPHVEEFNSREGILNEKAVTLLKRINYKSGLEFLPQLARKMPTFSFYLAGHIQDERLYDSLVYECIENGISNITYLGPVSSPSQCAEVMSLGASFVCLSPWEGTPVAVSEAALLGLRTYALAAEWNKDSDTVSVGHGIDGLAEKIMSCESCGYDRESVITMCDRTRKTIHSILRSV